MIGERQVIIDGAYAVPLTEEAVVAAVRAQFADRRSVYGDAVPDMVVVCLTGPGFLEKRDVNALDVCNLAHGTKLALTTAAGVILYAAHEMKPAGLPGPIFDAFMVIAGYVSRAIGTEHAR